MLAVSSFQVALCPSPVCRAHLTRRPMRTWMRACVQMLSDLVIGTASPFVVAGALILGRRLLWLDSPRICKCVRSPRYVVLHVTSFLVIVSI